MKTLRQYIVIIASLIVGSLTIESGFGCSWYPESNFYVITLFNTDVNNLQGTSPFYYTTSHFMFPLDESAKHARTNNLNEWNEFFDGKFNINELDHVIYELPLEEMELFTAPKDQWEGIFRGKWELERNQLLKHLATDDSATFAYLLYAKRCEQLLNYKDPWEIKKADPARMQEMIRFGVAESKKASNKTLKLRYAYQTVVLARYLRPAECIALYDSLIRPLNTASVLKYWALNHVSYAMHGTNRVPEANFAALEVFEHAPSKRVRAFHTFDKTIADSLFGLSRDPHQKAMIRVMQAINYPGRSLDKLEEIHRLSPGEEMMELLITREINKLEEWLVTPEYTEFTSTTSAHWESSRRSRVYQNQSWYKNLLRDKIYLDEFINFLNRLSGENGIQNKAFLELSIGHCYFMKRDYKTALQHLKKAQRFPTPDPKIELQIRKTMFLSELQMLDRITPVAESKIYEHLKWYEDNKEQAVEYERHMGSLLLAISWHYKRKGKKAKASLLGDLAQRKYDVYNDHEFYISYDSPRYPNYFNYLDAKGDPKDVQELIDLMDKSFKTPFEHFLTKDIAYDRNRVLDLKATLYFRQGKLTKSLSILTEIPESFWQDSRFPYQWYLHRNPFPGDTDSLPVTKPRIIERILDYQAKAKLGGPKAPWYYFQLGNAYRRMSHAGHLWMMYHYWQSDYNEYKHAHLKLNWKPYFSDYYGQEKALSYYLKAMYASRDAKFAAFCCRQAMDCRLAYHKYTQVLKESEESDRIRLNRKQTQLYHRLKTKYPAYHNELMTESCALWEEYPEYGKELYSD